MADHVKGRGITGTMEVRGFGRQFQCTETKPIGLGLSIVQYAKIVSRFLFADGDPSRAVIRS